MTSAVFENCQLSLKPYSVPELPVIQCLLSCKRCDPTCLSQNEANKIKKEAADLDRLIDQKLKDYEDLREDMRGKEQEVKNLLEKGKAEQQVSVICCWLHFWGQQFQQLRCELWL